MTFNEDFMDCILLENGKVYTYMYHKDSRRHMEIRLEELIVNNFEIRNSIMPEMMTMGCGLLTHNEDFGKEICYDIDLPNNVFMTVYLEKEYKDLRLKIQSLLEDTRNENPSILILDGVKNIKLLPMIYNIAKEYKLAVIVTMLISDRLNETIKFCYENELSVTEVIASGIATNDKIYNKFKHAFEVSDAVMLTVPFKTGYANKILVI